MATQEFGKYQLVKKLATGGMAEVWLAKQTGIEGFNRHVVLKRILPHLAEDPEFVQMFLNEAKIAARFNHPNIAQIYDLGENGGQYFIAMEFVHGEDLGRVMRRAWTTGQWVARPVAIRMVADACQGLYYAHTRSDDTGKPLRVVHRDISPQNILVSFDGSVKLVDFGIAKAADQMSSTKSGAIKGKFAYMAPEQASGRPLDARSDLFAIGLVLYELITGQRPLKRDNEIATLQAALECKIPAPSEIAEVPSYLDDVLMKALAKNADDRYENVRQFQMALEQLIVQEGAIATSVQVSELMETLFNDRLAEEAKSGTPSPASESSSTNPIPQAPPKKLATPAPAQTADGDDDEDDATLGADPQEQLGARGRKESIAAPRRTSSQAAMRAQSAQDTAAELEPVPSSPRRRTSSGGIKRRATSSNAMPDAPSRRASQAATPAAKVSRGVVPKASEDDPVDVTGMRRVQQSRFKTAVIAVAAVALLVLVFVMRDQLTGLFSGRSSSAGGVPVRLTVSTNPRTRVRVLPPPKAKGREVVELGDTPLEKVTGAYVGDTVELVNADRGIRYAQVVDPSRLANENVTIDKTFREGTLKVRTRPALKSATLWMDGVQLGKVGVPVKIFEGAHRIEIRGDTLTQTVDFEVKLGPNEVKDLEVDVTAAVMK